MPHLGQSPDVQVERFRDAGKGSENHWKCSLHRCTMSLRMKGICSIRFVMGSPVDQGRIWPAASIVMRCWVKPGGGKVVSHLEYQFGPAFRSSGEKGENDILERESLSASDRSRHLQCRQRRSLLCWKHGRPLFRNRPIETGATRLRKVQLGEVRIVDAPVLVADLPVFDAFGVADRPAVILGLDWLNNARMVIDFPASLVWFQKAS